VDAVDMLFSAEKHQEVVCHYGIGQGFGAPRAVTVDEQPPDPGPDLVYRLAGPPGVVVDELNFWGRHVSPPLR
jgi:hypothetical protein